LKIWNCLLQKKTCDVSISWAFSVLLIQNALCFFISVSILPVQNSTIVAETSESVQARSVKPFFYWEKSCVEILWCVRISVQGIRFRYQKKNQYSIARLLRRESSVVSSCTSPSKELRILQHHTVCWDFRIGLKQVAVSVSVGPPSPCIGFGRPVHIADTS
jgi:hypothetical protein